jgi:hypothetical protein
MSLNKLQMQTEHEIKEYLRCQNLVILIFMLFL